MAANIDAFKQAALSMGYDPNEVDSFVKMATVAQTSQAAKEDEELNQYKSAYEQGLPLDQIPSSYRAKIYSSSNQSVPQEFNTSTVQKPNLTMSDLKTQKEVEKELKVYQAGKKSFDKLSVDAQAAAIDLGLNAPESNAITSDQIQLETKLRGEINGYQEVKDYRVIKNSFSKIKSAQPTAQGDISLIFSYMKMLDPNSTVREGEYATAQNSAGIPGQIMNAYNRALSGKKLNDEQRRGFKQSAEDVYAATIENVRPIADTFKQYAKDYGVSEFGILGDLKSVYDYKKPETKSKQPGVSINLGGVGDAMKGVANAVGSAAPFVLATAGGLGGLAVGGPVGSAAGVAAGTGAGIGTREYIQDITGTQEQTQLEKAKESVIEPITAGAIDFVGGKVLGLASKAAGAVTPAIKSGLKKVFPSATNLLSKSGKALVNKLAGVSTDEYIKFAENTGKDLVDVAGKYIKGTSNMEELVGTPADRFTKGKMHDVLKVAEGQIQSKIKSLGDDAIITSEQFTSSLDDAVNQMSALPGFESKVAGIQDFVTKFKDMYKEGLSPKQLLQIKRAGDKIYEEGVESVSPAESAIRQSQKTVANAARAFLKEKYDDIAEALGTEQEVLELLPILKKQIGKAATTKSPIPEWMNKFHYTRPLSLIGTTVEGASESIVKRKLPSGVKRAGEIIRKAIPQPWASSIEQGIGVDLGAYNEDGVPLYK